MRLRHSIIWILVFGVVGSCLLAQKADEEPKPIACIYRNKEFGTRNWRPSVYVDDNQLARTQDGRYLVARLAPGKHVFRSELKQGAVTMDLKAGECYYFRVEITTGFWKAHGRLLAVTSEQAAVNLPQMKPIDRSHVNDESMVLGDEQAAAALSTCAAKRANISPPSTPTPRLRSEVRFEWDVTAKITSGVFGGSAKDAARELARELAKAVKRNL